MTRLFLRAGLLTASLLAGGCSSLMGEGTTAVAGMGGATIAGAVTNNAAVAAGIGLGVQAGAKAALQYGQRKVHGAAQDQIAQVAGKLGVGSVANWQTEHSMPMEPDEKGRVTVTRLLGTKHLPCKEIIFSVDNPSTGSAFYVAAICQDSSAWKWASAEPATERWGSLQ
jgi:hypothetical protein